MSRTSKSVTAVLLALALAALAVPVGLNLVPAFLAEVTGTATTTSIPAAQQSPTVPATLSGISALAQSAPLPSPDAVAKSLDAALATSKGDFTAVVLDAATGKELYNRNATAGRIPASNLKLLTALAALKTLGADTTLPTTVLAGSTPSSLVLRGGGDSLLTTAASDPSQVLGRAGLATLAAQTAGALKAAGTTGPVTLTVDDTLFTGPALNPHWVQGDVDAGEIAPIYPMALYGGRPDPAGPPALRPQDSAVTVGRAFAQALAAAGVQVSGDVARGTADDGAHTLGEVRSATVGEQVGYLLQNSDNYVAEVMGRLVSIAKHQDGSTTAAIAAVKSTVASMGVNTSGLVLTDCSGLAEGNLVSAQQLTQAVLLMASDPDENLRAGLLGLPIAGLSGTLEARYRDAATLAGAGVVRAKTGTLNEVLSLSGYVVDASGRLLVFSFIGNSFTEGSSSAKANVDAAATILAGCGCTGP